MEQATVFVSYCHQDVDPPLFDMIVRDLAADPRLKIISDKLARVGDDIEEFMSLVGRCHAVIILCTPEYNSRVTAKSGGVYTEYKGILDAHKRQNDHYNHDDPASGTVCEDDDPLKVMGAHVRDRRFAILPVLLRGTLGSSVPSEMKHLLAVDLVGLSMTEWRSTGQPRPQKHFRHVYDTFVKNVGTIATGVLALRNSDADKASKDVFNQIFFELKHDATLLDRDTIRRLFVKTEEFKRVSNQQSYILVGRKGSGKSTIVDFLAYGQSRKWKTPVLYNVDTIPLEYLFLITSQLPHQSDQAHVLTRANGMTLAWEALVHYLCFEIIAQEHGKGLLSSRQRQRFEPISAALSELETQAAFSGALRFMTELSSVQMARRHAFFGYALSRAIQFVSSVISRAPSVEAQFDFFVISNLTPEHFLVELFGQAFLASFYDIVQHCERNFLIALDGFDSQFQKFRLETFRSYRDTPDFEARTRFEQDWLTGLISAVRRFKRPAGTAPMSGKIDLCVTIPKDRFIEFAEYDRDAIEWERKRIDISWTGIELSILLRKRLEVYKRCRTNKEDSPLRRLSQILKEHFEWLPTTIPMTVERRTVEVDVFQYILRHTFWRPRDILFLWGRIISAGEYYRGRGIEFNASTVKLLVSRSLDAIITLEFIREFCCAVENIEEIVRRFEGSNQVLTFDDFFGRLRGVRLVRPLYAGGAASRDTGISDHEQILRLLYNIGFVGVYLSGKSVATQRFETPWVFIFNEGDSILAMQTAANRHEMRLVIHPIFIEYLGLFPYRDALVCDFRSDYLIKQEANQVASA